MTRDRVSAVVAGMMGLEGNRQCQVFEDRISQVISCRSKATLPFAAHEAWSIRFSAGAAETPRHLMRVSLRYSIVKYSVENRFESLQISRK